MANTNIVNIIARIARAKGVPVGLALAIAKWESGLDPNASGDGGHSIGLFQLNDHGEGSGMSVAAREDPTRNAEIALSEIARVYHANPGMSWGQVATGAQRPATYTFPKYQGFVNGAQKQYQHLPDNQVIAAYAANAPIASVASTGAGGPGGSLSTGQQNNSLAGNVSQALSGTYGYLSAFTSNPEIGPILQKAAAQGWNDNQMLAALVKTKWWQTTGDAARQWGVKVSTDPATAKQDMATTMSQVTAEANTMGITLSSQDVNHIAYASNMFGWSPLQLQQAIGGQFHYKSGTNYAGAAGTDIATLKATASQYMIPVSDSALQQWTQSALSGNKNISDFTAYAAGIAKSLYAGNKWMVKQIDSGVTPATAADPWKQLAAQTLEIAPDTIDFMNPKWMKAINQIGADGTSAPMSLDDWQRALKNDKTYGYDHTDGAMGAAATLVNQIGQAFGKVG